MHGQQHHKYCGAGLHCAVVCSDDSIFPPAYPINLLGALLISGPGHYLVQFCFFFSPTSLPFSYWPPIIRIVLLDVELETQKQIRALKILSKTQSGNGHPDSLQRAYIPLFRST